MPRNRKEKFKILAERRVSRLLKDMKLISNLSNRSNYEYEDQDAKKIISAIETELKYLKMQFNQNSNKNKSFRL
jgi:hypothetical protein